MNIIRRGDIYYADLRPVVGSEQGGVRPVLVIQNDCGNRHSPTIIIAAITSKMNKAKLPDTHRIVRRAVSDDEGFCASFWSSFVPLIKSGSETGSVIWNMK